MQSPHDVHRSVNTSSAWLQGGRTCAPEPARLPKSARLVTLAVISLPAQWFYVPGATSAKHRAPRHNLPNFGPKIDGGRGGPLNNCQVGGPRGVKLAQFATFWHDQQHPERWPVPGLEPQGIGPEPPAARAGLSPYSSGQPPQMCSCCGSALVPGSGNPLHKQGVCLRAALIAAAGPC